MLCFSQLQLLSSYIFTIRTIRHIQLDSIKRWQ
eukprot:SAG31_NODE_12652_length_927_cov_0.907005_2_plen_32_part_01